MTKSSVVQHIANLSAAGADVLLESALKAAMKLGALMTVAVVDNGGHLIALRRMDSASLISIDVAIGKAKTAVMLGRPTSAFGAIIDEGKFSMLGVPNVLPVPGGVPIILQGVTIGAIGVSGSTSDRDEAVAREAIDSLGVTNPER